MTGSYITVCRRSCEETIINKSRFIGYAAPCSDEKEALSFLSQIRDEHKSATHHCYAYIIGENAGIMRYSDDGEPGGTAGMPIMDVLRQKKIVNCCVVVVRYFGGVLLGTGGLVRAYTKSAQATVDSAGIACMELTVEESCELPYSSWDKFRFVADQLHVRISQINYSTSVSFQLSYRSADREFLIPRLMEAADRKLKSVFQREDYAAWTV